MTELLSLPILALAVYCFAISQLVQHGQLKWMSKDPLGFWGEDSDKRKYKLVQHRNQEPEVPIPAPDNWYTKLFDIKYKECWPTSTNLTVMFTDGYHLMQLFMLILISLSLTLAIGWNWYLFIGLMFGIRIVHWSGRKVFKK